MRVLHQCVLGRDVCVMTPEETWEDGLASEISFWEKVREYHPEWFAQGMDPETPIEPDVDELIGRIWWDSGDAVSWPIRILDVGSGMFSSMGRKTATGKDVHISYADILTESFRAIAAKQGFDLPVTHDEVMAEKLADVYGDGAFDIVRARNSIDHCCDARKAIQGMVQVLRPGGYMVLKHYEGCADLNRHEGLHQWNFYEHGGELWLEGFSETSSVTKLAHPCELLEVSHYHEGDYLLVKAIYRKPCRGGFA